MGDPSRGRSILLWVLAVALMLFAGFYQRRTGPSYPSRGEFRVAGEARAYRLVRSGTTGEDEVVEVPRPAGATGARLVYKRYPTEDEPTTVAMSAAGEAYEGTLPSQPPAGKLVYHVLIDGPGDPIRVPASPDDDPIIRFKGAVPAYVLAPHILLMFLSVMIGLRTGTAALLIPSQTRRLAFLTLLGMTVGGMILGPIVQKFAFGAFWTGFPFGYDLTDNKMLVMWLVWLVACGVIGRRAGRREAAGRIAVVAATVVMLVVFLIPHSLRGSELDYEKLEGGVSVEDAIGTGD